VNRVRVKGKIGRRKWRKPRLEAESSKRVGQLPGTVVERQREG